MNACFGPMCLAAVAVALFAGTAGAQVIVQPNVQYRAAVGGQPATAEPNSQISLPGDGNIYRVYCDYGILADGAFKATAGVSKGGASRIVIPKTGLNSTTVRLVETFDHLLPVSLSGANGNYNWSVSGPQTLTNPAAGLYARARIQVLDGTKWVDVPKAVTYAPVPIPEG